MEMIGRVWRMKWSNTNHLPVTPHCQDSSGDNKLSIGVTKSAYTLDWERSFDLYNRKQ
jgi:hypothetical protein